MPPGPAYWRALTRSPRAQAICLGVPSYLLAGLSLSSPATPLLYLATLWLSTEASCSTISLITALSPNAVVAFAILSAVYTMYAAFGFLLVYSVNARLVRGARARADERRWA